MCGCAVCALGFFFGGGERGDHFPDHKTGSPLLIKRNPFRQLVINMWPIDCTFWQSNFGSEIISAVAAGSLVSGLLLRVPLSEAVSEIRITKRRRVSTLTNALALFGTGHGTTLAEG